MGTAYENRTGRITPEHARRKFLLLRADVEALTGPDGHIDRSEAVARAIALYGSLEAVAERREGTLSAGFPHQLVVSKILLERGWSQATIRKHLLDESMLVRWRGGCGTNSVRLYPSHLAFELEMSGIGFKRTLADHAERCMELAGSTEKLVAYACQVSAGPLATDERAVGQLIAQAWAEHHQGWRHDPVIAYLGDRDHALKVAGRFLEEYRHDLWGRTHQGLVDKLVVEGGGIEGLSEYTRDKILRRYRPPLEAFFPPDMFLSPCHDERTTGQMVAAFHRYQLEHFPENLFDAGILAKDHQAWKPLSDCRAAVDQYIDSNREAVGAVANSEEFTTDLAEMQIFLERLRRHTDPEKARAAALPGQLDNVVRPLVRRVYEKRIGQCLLALRASLARFRKRVPPEWLESKIRGAEHELTMGRGRSTELYDTYIAELRKLAFSVLEETLALSAADVQELMKDRRPHKRPA